VPGECGPERREGAVRGFADLLRRYDKMSAEELRRGDPDVFGT
jgi:hypothetical protein